MDSVVPYFANSSADLFITLDGRYDGPFQARRSVKGLRSITLELLEFGYWDYFSDHQDEPERRTIMAMTTRLEFRNPTLLSDFPIFL